MWHVPYSRGVPFYKGMGGGGRRSSSQGHTNPDFQPQLNRSHGYSYAPCQAHDSTHASSS